MTRGDQIYVYRELLNLPGFYRHHGIDCGDNTAIHYRKPSETIERTSLTTFSRGKEIFLQEYPHGFCFIPDVVVHRAQSRLGEQKYNLLFNNCEHFATWCKTGISYSQQVSEFIPAIAKLNVEQLYEPLQQALKQTDLNNAQKLLQEALVDIKVAWDDIQPQYQNALKEMEIWHQVAQQALRQNREDLARAALHRQLSYKRQARELQQELQKLATMTETLMRNSNNLTFPSK